MQTVNEAFEKLGRSKFRSKFHLSSDEIRYIDERGLDTIRVHAAEMIKNRLSPAEIINDGRQTPWKGHPVFVAQHACACCCRKCLNKWYNVPMHTQLSEEQQKKIVNLLMQWIEREYMNEK